MRIPALLTDPASSQEILLDVNHPVARGSFSRILPVARLGDEDAPTTAAEGGDGRRRRGVVCKYPVDSVQLDRCMRRPCVGDYVLVPMRNRTYEPAVLEVGHRLQFDNPRLRTAVVPYEEVQWLLMRSYDDRQSQREAEVTILRRLAALDLAPQVRAVVPVQLHERVPTPHFAVCMDRCDCTLRQFMMDPTVADSERWAVLHDVATQLGRLAADYDFVHGDLKASNVGIMRGETRVLPSGHEVPHRFVFLDTGFSRMRPESDPESDATTPPPGRVVGRYYEEEPPPGHDARMVVVSLFLFMERTDATRAFLRDLESLYGPVRDRMVASADPRRCGLVSVGLERLVAGHSCDSQDTTGEAWQFVYDTRAPELHLTQTLRKFSLERWLPSPSSSSSSASEAPICTSEIVLTP